MARVFHADGSVKREKTRGLRHASKGTANTGGRRTSKPTSLSRPAGDGVSPRDAEAGVATPGSVGSTSSVVYIA